MQKAKNSIHFWQMLLLSFCSALLGAWSVYIVMRYLPHNDSAITEVAQNLDAQQSVSSPRLQSPDHLRSVNSEYTQNEQNNIAVYEETNQAVVNITALKKKQFFNWFFEPIPRRDEAIGSGSIIDGKGYVLTNNHVIQNASKLLLTLYDGTQFEGEIAGSDPENDLAIVRFDPKGRRLRAISFVENGTLQVGQKVFAIGNPYGFERTLTVGIVSGLGRPIQNENGLIIQDMIQTDASINPGNSGGPLLNSAGKMIGVNSSIYSPTGSSVGLGFAVPISTIKRVLPDLIRYGEVLRGWIDIQVIPLFPQLVRYSRLPVEKGLLVSQVARGSEAEKAGLRGGRRDQAVRSGSRLIYLGGDIITQIDGVDVDSMADLYSALEPTRPGDEVVLTVMQRSASKKIRVKLSNRKRRS